MWRTTHIAIAYYEIENINFNETEKIFELHLTDKDFLIFIYDQTKDYNKGLNNLCNRFKITTSKTPVASKSWKD